MQVLVFCFVDLLATDFLLAAIVTYVVSKGLSVFRFSYFSPCRPPLAMGIVVHVYMGRLPFDTFLAVQDSSIGDIVTP